MVNTGFADSASDHDPLLARFTLDVPDGVVWGTTDSDYLFGSWSGETIYARAGDDFVVAGVGDDLIYGGDGDDRLLGNYGDDILWGGPGNDTLFGNGGSNIFVLAVGEGTDTIRGFNLRQGDLIGLAGGLTFGQLSVAQDLGEALIAFEDEILAILSGVKASDLTEAAFITMG